MFRSLLSLVSFSRSTKISQPVRLPARRCRLGVESLEGRDVPATLNVNTLSDAIASNTVLSLREAIGLNNGTLLFSQLSAAEKAQVSGTVGTNDRINFSVTGTINLASDLPALTKKLTIEGPAASQLTINGSLVFRPINVSAAGDVTVSGLRLYHGTNIDSGGAAINAGKLTFSRVEFDSNTAGKHGAAIENNGTLVVDECYFHDNNALKVGGAIDNNATATITDSTFSKNTSGNTGGAIWSDGTLNLINCTIVENHAVNAGGAIRVTGGTTNITSCTIVGNDADSDGSGIELGGGISNGGSTVTLKNTVVAGNFRDQKAFKSDIDGAVSGQYNFIGVDLNMTGLSNGVNNNAVGTAATPLNPLLMVLANNGGFAPTQMPAKGSSLVGTGAPNGLAGLTDQRGAGRSGAITIGAVQIASPLSPIGVTSQLYGPGPIASADEAFVKGLYRACLLRDADPAGLANWLSFLSGHPERRNQVVHGFYNSTENRGNQVDFYYRYFLGREAEPAGKTAWIGVLQTGVDEAVVMRGFILSPEYTGQNNNTQFVNTMYFALLGRNAEPAGFNTWKAALDSNQYSRGQVVDLFVRSPESIQRVVTSYYETYLGVAPTAGELNSSTAAVQAGYTFGTIAEVVLNSQAFYNNGAAKVGL